VTQHGAGTEDLGAPSSTNRSSLSLLRILVPRGQRRKWLVVGLLAVAVAAAETVAAVSIAVLIDVIGGGVGSTDGLPVVGDLAKILPGDSEQEKLAYFAAGMAAFFVLKGLLVFTQTYAQERVAENTGARVGSRLFEGYLGMPYVFHIRHNSSELIRNASWATDEVVRNFLKPVIVISTQATLLVFLVGILVASAPRVTLIVVGVVLPVTLGVVRLVKPTLKRLGTETKAAMQDSLRSLQQSLHGIRDVKVLRREEFFAREYRRTRFQLARAKYFSPAISEVPRLAVETLLIAGILVFLVTSSGAGDGTSLAVLGMFAYAGLRMMPATSAIVAAVNRIRYGQSVAETLVEDLEMVNRQSTPSGTPSNYVLEFRDSLELVGVSFRYDTGRPVLRGIDLEIQRGETIGIVGETGAGKSTLLDLILGLLEPSQGQVLVGGEDLKTVSRSWQDIIGLVPQTIYLLDDTIRRNIAFGLADSEIDDDTVRQAIQMARLESFIDQLDDGLDTVVGERGVRLSGGQRQRVAIARALYRRPQVLILDEGTASLDNVTEAELMKAIDPLKGSLTIIMVAHRLTTVMNCDRVILMRAGEVADEGTFEELRQRNLEFRKMTG
jgi:ATP-binding cassette subfamily C protein